MQTTEEKKCVIREDTGGCVVNMQIKDSKVVERACNTVFFKRVTHLRLTDQSFIFENCKQILLILFYSKYFFGARLAAKRRQVSLLSAI